MKTEVGIKSEPTASSLLNNWKKRPEPHQVAQLTEEEILQGALSSGLINPFQARRVRESMTFSELLNIIPILKDIVTHVINNYSDHTILVVGRDGEIIYDALKTVTKNQTLNNSIYLFPGSTGVMGSIASNLNLGYIEEGFVRSSYNSKNNQDFSDLSVNQKDAYRAELYKKFGKDYDPARILLIRKFFAQFGITEDALSNKRKYLVLDTGYKGSIGGQLTNIITRLYNGMLDNRDLFDLFQIRLVGTWTNSIHAVERIIDFDYDITTLKQKFPKTTALLARTKPPEDMDSLMRDFWEPGEMTSHFILATVMQLMPRYHDCYRQIIHDNNEVIAIPAPHPAAKDRFRGDINYDIDEAHSYNHSIINPYAAMLFQKIVVDYFCNQ